MSEFRQSWCYRLIVGMIWLTLLAVPSWGNPPGASGYRGWGRQSPVVVLNGEFFQAMQKFSDSSGLVSGDRTENLLEQIAITSKFIVKTNLTLVDQNEKIIRLLEDLKNQGQQKENH